MNEKQAIHSPGPWKTHLHISLDRWEIRDAGGRRIADCAMDFPMSAKTHDANARLIAAAPELLAALKGLVEHCTIRQEAEAAIAAASAAMVKAEGEE